MTAGDIVRVYLLPNRNPLILGMYLRDNAGFHIFIEVGKPALPWSEVHRLCYIHTRDVGAKYELEIVA